MKRLLLVMVLSAVLAPSVRAQARRFEPDRWFNTFSFAHPPLLTLNPGDRVVTKTLSSGGRDAEGRQAAQAPNPVYEPGALLFIGDGHARQGHGEVVGTGLEIPMEVEFSVDLVKGKSIGWPRLENQDYIMVLGSARPLTQAFQHATTEMLEWLMADYGFDERTASMLMGVVMEYEIAQVVDPNFTVVAKVRRNLLPAPGG